MLDHIRTVVQELHKLRLPHLPEVRLEEVYVDYTVLGTRGGVYHIFV